MPNLSPNRTRAGSGLEMPLGVFPRQPASLSQFTFWPLLRRALCLLGMAGGLAISLHGQTAAPEEEGAPVIGRLEISYLALQNVSREVILSHLQIREGMPYSQTLVDRSIRSLYDTNLFDYIEAKTDAMAGDQIKLTFVVQPKYRLGKVSFAGNDEYSVRRLRGKTKAQPGQRLDERAIRKDRDEILKYYHEKGFTRASVDYTIERSAESGEAAVTYNIEEGPRLKIKAVNFVGNQAFSQRKLRGEIETRRRWFFSWLTGSGRFDETKFQEDLDKLRTFYIDNGYLDVNVAESNVTLDFPTEKHIVITVRIDEGRQYKMGNITFENNKIYSDEILARVIRLLPGDVFSPSKLEEDIEHLKDIYGAAGYLEASARAERQPNLATGHIDVRYLFTEGDRFLLESVKVEGNTKTKSIVIVRELALTPGTVFNTVWMKNSEARLKNTRFFEEVNLSPESTSIPGRRDLKVTVKEARTGQFQFGAGFSSLEKLVIFFELSQSNFDLFNYRSFFQGDGQKFRFRVSVGSSSNEVVIGFEEPWFLERRLALGFELFRRSSDYSSNYFNEVRTGLEVYLRQRLYELVDGQLAYRLENVDIADVVYYAPQEIRNEAGSRIVSKVSFSLVRDTRDEYLFTTRGSRLQFTTEFAGVGGNTKYVKFETRNAFYVPTFEYGEQVLSVLGRAGSFWEYSDERVPFFDRFFLGGPESLRGFEYRDVGPRSVTTTSPSETIGGNSYGFGSLEYSVKVAPPLRLAIFYDWGFVNRRDFDFNPSGYNDNWGFGIRLLILGNPLRLDFGIPIHSTIFRDPVTGAETYSNNQGNQFNFSFGTRF